MAGVLADPLSANRVSLAPGSPHCHDIDQIISQALAYALLTVLLGVVYASGVSMRGQLLNPVDGDSSLAVAASTLAVALLSSRHAAESRRLSTGATTGRRGNDSQPISGTGARRTRHRCPATTACSTPSNTRCSRRTFRCGYP